LEVSNKTQSYFEVILQKLDSVINDLKTQNVSFTETQKVQFLKEVIKEQVQDENSRHTAC
jgi:hypothetical protein